MKAAFVTGANKGLGSGFVEQLLKKNYRVFGGTRHIGASIQQENLTWIPLELESDASVAQAAKSALGSVDSIDQAGKILAITEDWSDELNGKFLNYDGSLYPL
jgi:NAD(P)-dependent dehydrogenase (short-subunit alcohol dehydrogenase family)